MLQAKCLGSFHPEPKALTFSHQQPALKQLCVCSSWGTGVEQGWKHPVTGLAPASLMSYFIFVIQILSLSRKENAAVLNSSSTLLKATFESRGNGCTAGLPLNFPELISWLIYAWTVSCLQRHLGEPGLIARGRTKLNIAIKHINT